MSRRIFSTNDKYKIRISFVFVIRIFRFVKDCWKIVPHERPTFSDLLEQINQIIEINSTNNEEFYQSLQKDWRQEIQDMFNELKEKEQVKLFSSLEERKIRKLFIRKFVIVNKQCINVL